MRRAWRWESLGSETDETLTQGEHSLQINVEWPSGAFVTDWDLFSLVGKLFRGGRSHYHRYSHPIMRICPENKSNSVAWQSFSIWPECLIFIWFMWPEKKKKTVGNIVFFFFFQSNSIPCETDGMEARGTHLFICWRVFSMLTVGKTETLASFPLRLWWW